MKDISLIFLVGYLGNDPELRYTPDGTAVCRFNLATNYQGLNKKTNQMIKKTEWHRIVIFGELAQTTGQSLKSGSHAGIKGQNHTRKYTDKNGIQKVITEIVVQAVFTQKEELDKLVMHLSQLEGV